MAWVYSDTIVNGEAFDGAELMLLMGEALAGLTNLDDGSISFFTEANGPVVMDAEAGHTHDGVNSRLLSLATTAKRGGLKAFTSEAAIEYLTYGSAGAAVDFNAGSGITTILAAMVLWRATPATTPENFAPDEAADAWTNCRATGDGETPFRNYHAVLDTTASPNKLHVFNRMHGLSAGQTLPFRAFILGV